MKDCFEQHNPKAFRTDDPDVPPTMTAEDNEQFNKLVHQELQRMHAEEEGE
jgi:hypothetical protein